MMTNSTSYKIGSINNFTSLVNSQLRNLESNKIETRKQVEHKKNKALKPVVVASSALGILLTLSLISKGKSNFNLLKPQTWKNLASDKAQYGAKEVIATAGGSILGGMVGGIIIDDKKNAKHKAKEGISQMVGNILVPVSCVSLANFLVKDFLKIPEKMPQLKSISKIAKCTNGAIKSLPGIAFSLLALGFGIIGGNKIANKLNSVIFDKGEKKEDRQIKVSDLAVHIDDICYTSTLIAPDNRVCEQVGKFVPLALMIAGVSTGLADGEKHHH